MALYMYVCSKCKKKVYLNFNDVKLYIADGRKHICPECEKSM